MALLADGWHMATHVAALGISLFAYRYARMHAEDQRYTFGTGKVGVLGGFASAVVLAVVAALMGLESAHRFLSPQAIRFDQSILVAVIGLVVNLLSAWWLGGREDSGPGHDAATPHDHDHNLKAAYLHVLADALTSLLAILALLSGKFFGWVWMDPLMGLVGGILIGAWSYGLLRDTGHILLDSAHEPEILDAVRSAIEAESDDRVSDLHVWKVSAGRYAAIVSVVTREPMPPEHYKDRLAGLDGLVHVTVEVHRCAGEDCRNLSP